MAGLTLASATIIVGAGTSSAAMADPSSTQRPTVRGAGAPQVVPDRYIVVLKDKTATPQEVKSTASALAGDNGGTVRQVYTHALRGYSAAMNRRQAERVAADPSVAYVEPVAIFSATDTQSNPPSWGLDRIDQSSPKRDNSYTYPATGHGVTAYILDTGIDIAHADFQGRARYGRDTIDNDDVAQDCDGHGTHVAGTVGGTTFGVAKGVQLVGVRVLDCYGSGSSEQIIAGIDWVTANAVKPAVANMSLAFGGNVQAVNDAVNRSIGTGVTYAIAAGNSAQNACDISPANVPAAITVGATDKIDYKAWFSNYGSCVDTFAPGVSIVSAAAGTPDGSLSISGTSMASPHVAGAAAQLLELNPTWTPQQVRDRIVTTGVAGAVHDAEGATDRVLNVRATGPDRASHGFRARSNGNFVMADGAGSKPLVALGSALGTWEKYDIVDAGGGQVAFRSKVNGKYVSATGAGTKPLVAEGPSISTWEKFQLINNTDGTVSLKALVNGKYVTAPNNGAALTASRPSISTWEKFDVEAPSPVVSIKSLASGKYVSADGAGSQPLVPVANSASTWEKFEVINLGGGFVTFRALVNGKYVSAEGRGTLPLRASGPTPGSWEVFDFLDYNPEGSVYLRAYIDGQAVTAGDSGTSQLTSSKTIDWFDLENLGLGVGEKFVVEVA
ncbi:S8 family serine peptidase [Micromonospora krabiensis]|uniref:S8 family serine peptidase n=1 Tax=Micromonospora krabiensis TaxID=307121 RepID=UPI001E4D5E5E|nr:S8 family serine peptidase [Micromonospora krabiensis]